MVLVQVKFLAHASLLINYWFHIGRKCPNMLISRTLNCWIQWGFTEIARKLNLVAWRTGFEPSKVWGFTKIPRTIILVAWRSDLNLRRYGDLQKYPER
jgi:hypothetical protein